MKHFLKTCVFALSSPCPQEVTSHFLGVETQNVQFEKALWVI